MDAGSDAMQLQMGLRIADVDVDADRPRNQDGQTQDGGIGLHGRKATQDDRRQYADRRMPQQRTVGGAH